MANNLAKDENSSKQDPRHIARILVLQFLFTKHRTSHFKEANNYEANILLNELEEQKFDNRLYEKLIEGVEENEKDLDSVITEYAPAWPLGELNPVDLIILRMAIWEIKYYSETPFKVVINESIEICKIFSSEQSSKFINGVLGNLTKEFKMKDENNTNPRK